MDSKTKLKRVHTYTQTFFFCKVRIRNSLRSNNKHFFQFSVPLGEKSTHARGSSHEDTVDSASYEVLFVSQEDGPFYFTKYNFISGDFYTKYFESTYILQSISFSYFIVSMYLHFTRVYFTSVTVRQRRLLLLLYNVYRFFPFQTTHRLLLEWALSFPPMCLFHP